VTDQGGPAIAVHITLTGAPGAGKTSLIAHLAALGYQTVPEAATDIIAQAQAAGQDRPWEDPHFTERIAALQLARLEAAGDRAGLVFHDRGPVCTLALARFLGHAPGPRLRDAMARAQADMTGPVFLVELMGFVTPTPARRIDLAGAQAFEQVHRDTYAAENLTARAAQVLRVLGV
jgi:predicted ATPase